LEASAASPNWTRRPVIIQFCGTSEATASGLRLIVNICHQIHRLKGIPFDSENISSLAYGAAVLHFQKLLHDFPIVLFIDSLDQLTNDNQARSDISFLKGVAPHPDTRIIVSCLPDERDPVDASKWKYIYGCSTKLAEAQVTCIQVPLLASGADDVMIAILKLHGRKLTGPQLDLVRSCVAVEPSVLYLQLAALGVSTWTSEDYVHSSVLSCPLVGGVANVINQIVDGIANIHGQALTEAALAFITLSVAGVNDEEMCDLLSLDDKVLSKDVGINKYNHSARVPVHVWIILKSALQSLIVERSGGCMRWYHRQLHEVIMNRYAAEDKLYFQRLMACYFGNIVVPVLLPQPIALVRGISPQPLTLNCPEQDVWFPQSMMNSRRCDEAVDHMLAASMFTEAQQELCSLQAMCARAKCGTFRSFSQ